MTFEFISKMYNNRNSYAEVFTKDELNSIHVSSNLEETLKDLVKKGKFILLTGNPGDGKTHLIRMQKSFLEKYNTFIELDINEVQNHKEFLMQLRNALINERPVVIAINEYPLYELLKSMEEDFPYKKEIVEIKNNNIIYGDECGDYSNQRVVIIDLNNRNLLNKVTLEEAFLKLIGNTSYCDHCDDADNCLHNQALTALKHPKIRERVIKLFSLIGNIGIHAVMRDILGAIAYILTEGKKCTLVENKYYDLLFNGNNSLFEAIRKLDPSKLSHPRIDEQLWYGLITDGWYLSPPSIIPNNIEDADEAIEAFISIKRKYFFEHENGERLFPLYPKQLLNFLDLITKASDEEIDVLQKIILSINRFYNPAEQENQKLFIWNSHSYEAKNYPDTILSNRSIPYQNMEILVPKLPLYLKALNYTPDHFLLRVNTNQIKKEYVDLVINYDLYKMLMLIAEGYPPQVLPNNNKFTIERFMYKLSASTKKNQTNEFIIRSIKHNSTRKIIIKDGKYLIKSR